MLPSHIEPAITHRPKQLYGAESEKKVLMDTDDLTTMAYEIIVRADEILDVLKTEIGASCAKYDNEDSFIKGTLDFINRKIEDPEPYLDFWNYLDEIDIVRFKNELNDLKMFIIKVIDTPLQDRGEPPFK